MALSLMVVIVAVIILDILIIIMTHIFHSGDSIIASPLMGQYCFACCHLSASSVVIICRGRL